MFFVSFCSIINNEVALMENFTILNTFFNMILGNEPAYMRALFSSYEDFVEMRQWMRDKKLPTFTLDTIDETVFRMLRPKMTANEVGALLHTYFVEEMKQIQDLYKNRLQVLMLPSLEKEIEYHLDIAGDNIDYYEVKDIFYRNDLSFFDPFPPFLMAINHCDLWGGVLVFDAQNEVFCPIHNDKDKDYVEKALMENNVFDILRLYDHDSYFIQISDLHLGREKTIKGLNQLYTSLDYMIPKLHSHYKPKFLITGDLMESPNRKNMYLANDFMIHLKKIYKADITFILGNHDVIVHGFNMGRTQKSKVIAYLLGEHVKVIEDEKLVIIKIDSTSEGNLARGKVGQRQLKEIDDELDTIDHLEDYTIIVMVHHHVYPITKAQFLKTKWHEKTFINKILESSKALVDADLLIQWLDKRHIQYVLHGHKHLPFFRKEEQKFIISGGSSTGSLKESKSKYISYNLIKYNNLEKKMKTCIIFYDDKQKTECQRVEVYLFEEE